jgi:hypothetical protein
MELHKISPSRLLLLESGQFIVRYITDYTNLGIPAVDPEFKELHDSLLAQSPIYNRAIAQVLAQKESGLISNLDKSRDQKSIAMRKQWSLYRTTDNPIKLEAYNSLKTTMNKYLGIETLNYEAETLALDNYIKQLRDPIHIPALNELNMIEHLNNLETAHIAFTTTFASRSNTQITTISYDTKKLRETIFFTYKELTDYIRIMANRKKTADYISILTAINYGRDYYNGIISRRNKDNEPPAQI